MRCTQSALSKIRWVKSGYYINYRYAVVDITDAYCSPTRIVQVIDAMHRIDLKQSLMGKKVACTPVIATRQLTQQVFIVPQSVLYKIIDAMSTIYLEQSQMGKKVPTTQATATRQFAQRH